MTIKYIVLCRYNSSRLPGKILKQIQGIPVLEILLKRLCYSINRHDIVVATSTEPSDDPIEKYCIQQNIHVYRGSLENVAERFLTCANTYKADYAVRINGDNIFTDPVLIQELVSKAIEQKVQFASNVPKRTFPTGVSVEVVGVAFYQSILSFINEHDKYKEHVTLALYENPSLLQNFVFIENNGFSGAHGAHLALDTPEDFKLAESIITYLGNDFISASWKKIIETKIHLYE